MARGDWTPERLKQLEEMHQSGATFGAIAKHFGVSRSAIAGKVRRLKLPQRTPVNIGKRKRITGARNDAIKAGRKRARGKRPTLPSLSPKEVPVGFVEPEYKPSETVWLALEGSNPVDLCTLEKGQCKWPVGDTKPQLFCGLACEDRFCTAHAKIAFKSVTEAGE